MLEILTNARKRKGLQVGEEKVKLFIFAGNEKVGNLSVYNTTPRSDTFKIKGYIVKIYKSILLEIQFENENNSIYNSIKYFN